MVRLLCCALAFAAVSLAACNGSSYVVVNLDSRSPLSFDRVETIAENAGTRATGRLDRAAAIPPRQSYYIEVPAERTGEVTLDVTLRLGETVVGHAIGSATLDPHHVVETTLYFGEGVPSVDAGLPDAGATPDLVSPPDLAPVVPIQIAAGASHTCVLLSDGTVKCFGSNASQQLGLGENSAVPQSDVPVTVPGLAGVKQIAAGDTYSCAVLVDGTLKCWGNNGDGQLGVNDGAMVHGVPQTVVQLSGVTGVACGLAHTCAIVDKGQVRCWGRNSEAQVGVVASGGPVLVPSPSVTWTNGRGSPPATLGSVKELALGSRHSCALLVDGTVYCWGLDGAGLLGRNTVTGVRDPVAQPVQLKGAANRIAASFVATCAVLVDNTGACWGSEEGGTLGAGLATMPSGGGGGGAKATLVPVPICSVLETPCTRPATGLTDVAMSGQNSCVIANGNVSCFGYGGLLGDGSSTPRPFPSAVTLTGARALWRGRTASHSCAIQDQGTAWCWGKEASGDFGDAQPDGARLSPSQVVW